MLQDLLSDHGMASAPGYDPQWGNTLGPMGPLAVYSQPGSQFSHSQTLQSGQVNWNDASTPNRQAAPKEPRNSGGAKERAAEKQDTSRVELSNEEEVRAILTSANIDDTRIQWLVEEGFSSKQTLRLLTTEAVEALIDKSADGPTPLAQGLALKQLARGMTAGHVGSGAPRNPQSSPGDSGSPGSRGVSAFNADTWEPEMARSVLNPTLPRQMLNPQPMQRMDFQYPTLMMRMQGKHISYHDVTDFVPGFLVEKERLTLPGSDGKVIFETGPKRPALHKITLAQWNCANARIQDTVILEGSLNINSISDYLAYTQKVNRMQERFEWETVLLFDREYRQLQASVGMRWGVDVRHLSDIHLREKVAGLSQGQSRRDRQNKGKAKNNAVDPKSGKELCLNFNRGQCLYNNCKFVHVCSQCFEKHTATSHDRQGNKGGH